MQKNGINPDVAPKAPSEPSLGPAQVPITLDDVQLFAFSLDTSEDVGAAVGLDTLPKSLSWTWVFSKPDANEKASPDGSAIAAAAAAQGLTVVPAPVQLYVVDVVSGDDGVPKVVRSEEQPTEFGRAGGLTEYVAGGSRKRLLL
jgi:hypothetical protein